MVSKVDYYTSLSRAVAGIDRDSYGARGAVYDREYKALMRRLVSSDPPHTDAEIEGEQHAFREAVRRIEFGDEEAQVPLVPQREPLDEVPALVAAAARLGERSFSPAPLAPLQQKSSRDVLQWPRPRTVRPPQDEKGVERAPEPALSRPPEAAAPATEVDVPSPDVALLTRRPIAGRVFGRALIGLVLLGAGIATYSVLTRDIGLPLPQKPEPISAKPSPPVETAPTGTQQVILFDGNRPDPNATKFTGTATWQLRSETPASQGEPAAVVRVDLEVPGRKVALSMTMRREPPTSVMSHLLEFRFLREDKQPDPDITNIAAVVMTTADMTRPTVLGGQVISVTPGVFLFGLSGDASDREKNLRSLQDLTWMGIPIAYRNGAAGILLVEKGDDGERALNEALRQWGQ